MKAPEKVYIIDPTGEFDDHWSICQNNNAVEYTRTDAFLMKARKWFEQMSEFFDFNGIRHYAKDDFEDFRKYMEGE